MHKIAFYKGKGDTLKHRHLNAAIKSWTGGPYSHVELVHQKGIEPSQWLWYSADSYEGKVAIRTIEYKPNNWDMFEIEMPLPIYAYKFIESQKGKPYDYIGLFLASVIPENDCICKSWFCSKLIWQALCESAFIPCNRTNDYYSPNALFKMLNSNVKQISSTYF